ncbi:hypothetical protein BH10PSE19_BH10PSE19_02950 [soil metagenome]
MKDNLKVLGSSLSVKNTFRVINVQGDPADKNVYINYQTKNPMVILKEKPAKLIENILVVSGFSVEESQMIYQLACEEMQSPDLRIKAIRFVDNNVLFEIAEIAAPGNVNLISATDILYNHSLSKKFSANDLEKICYQHTQDHHLIMKQELQDVKKNNPKKPKKNSDKES